MGEQTDYEVRKSLIHLLNSGQKPGEAARELKRSPFWAYKWQNCYEQEGWAGLYARSRAPKHVPNRISAKVRQAILWLRNELEAEAEHKDSLGYIGADAIYGMLRTGRLAPE